MAARRNSGDVNGKRSSSLGAGQKSISSFFVTKPKQEAGQADADPPAKKQKMEPLNAAGATKAVSKGPSKTPPQAKSFGKSSRQAQHAPDDAPSDQDQGSPAIGQKAVGRRIKVWWPDDKDWFEGEVLQHRANGQHLVAYDDGDEEWLHLSKEKFELLSSAGPRRKLSKKRKSVVLSDDEEEGAAESESNGSGSDWGKEGAAEAAAVVTDDDDVSMEAEGSEGSGKTDSDDESPANTKRGKKGAPGRMARTKGRTPATKTPASRPLATSTPASSARQSLSVAERGRLQSSLEQPTPVAEVAGGSKATLNTDADRFAARAASKFPFLHPAKIRDGEKRRPDHPDYDPGTLHIPEGWFKQEKISDGQRQWWEFKARHFDAVMLFKMGKFYEMFEMDSHIGAEVLGLIYMKGDQPHCGFPEKNYHSNAERLARAGYKVVVVEQTETPDQLKIRNEERKASKQNMVKVVNRELVAILTKGTLTDAEMLQTTPDAAYLLAVTEELVEDGGAADATQRGHSAKRIRFGACAVDVATGRMLLGQWDDDDLRTQLRAHITALMPAELILPRGRLSAVTHKLLRASLRSPRINELVPGKGGFWNAEQAFEEICAARYFVRSAEPAGGSAATEMVDERDTSTWPAVLQAVTQAGEACSAAMCALGGCISYLRQLLLDRSVVPLKRLEALPGCPALLGAAESTAEDPSAAQQGPEFMAMDGAALENLEVLESTEGGRSGTLMAALDHCSTPAGKRRLSTWLCRPLARIHAIRARQDAVADLMGPDLADAVGVARKTFAGCGDLERSLARLHATGLGGGMGRDQAHVVLYEDNSRRNVNALIAALRGLQALDAAVRSFEPHLKSLASTLLRQLLTPGQMFPDLAQPLAELEQATDWEEATSTGRVVPAKGVDSAFDDAEEGLEQALADLQAYLMDVRRQLGAGAEVSYVSLNKDPFLLEVPESLLKKVPSSFELASQKKGYRRYMSPPLRELVAAHAAAQEVREAALSGILQGLLRRFASQAELWTAAVDTLAQIDALMSLASAAQFGTGGPLCRPVFLEPTAGQRQVFSAVGLRHPAAGAGLQSGTFVPNTVHLGGDSAPFIVLTGPNMGGKSTLMRQVCLAAVMAQVGAWVPAESLTLSPVDAAFVRMGAKDAIMSGMSTAYVEFSETAAALNRATPASLVVLDELGRGTATTDGVAIAAAVLEHLSHRVGCRGLFATHFHKLADVHADDPAVSIRHMACAVRDAPSSQPDQVPDICFLYKLTKGACPKSYGTNVARLAGLPDAIVQRAAAFSASLEREHNNSLAVVRSDLAKAVVQLKSCGAA